MSGLLLKEKKLIAILGMFAVVLCACKAQLPVAEEISYTDVVADTSKKDLLKIIGAKPNKVEEQDNLTSYIYEKSKYLSYTGEMSYYLVEDKVVFSRWETTTTDEKEGKEIYKNISGDLENKYGKGTESKANDMMTCSWTDSAGKTKTLTYAKTADNIKVSIMETGN